MNTSIKSLVRIFYNILILSEFPNSLNTNTLPSKLSDTDS